MSKLTKLICGAAVGLFLAVAGLGMYIRHLNNELDVSQHNLKVATEQVQQLTLSNGQHVSTINSYILEKKQLQEYLDMSKSEVKELEKALKSKVASVTKVESQVKYDTITVENVVDIVHGDTLTYHINYNQPWIKFNSATEIMGANIKTTFSDFVVPVPLQVGMTDDYRIWVKSDNPYLQVTDVRGAVIEGSRLNRKQKRWGLGMQLGIGGQYDLTRKQFGFGPYIGVGISYNFLNF